MSRHADLDRLTGALRDGTDAWCDQLRAVDRATSWRSATSRDQAAARRASRRARAAVAMAGIQCLILTGLLLVGAALLPTTVWA